MLDVLHALEDLPRDFFLHPVCLLEMVQMQDALLNHHELALQADGKEAWAFLTAAGEPYNFFGPPPWSLPL